MPIVFALGVSGLLGLVLGNFSLQKLPSSLVAGSQSWVLLAIPTFVFAGSLMERCGMSYALVNLARVLVGWLRGGLGVPVVVVAGFYFGAFTATEAGALVAFYAIVAAFLYYRNVTLREMLGLVYESALLTAAVMFLLAVASVYQFLLGMLGVPAMLGEILQPLESTPWLFLVAITLLVMMFGMVMEGLPAAVVLIPVVFPTAKRIGIHPIHFDIVLTAAVGIAPFLPPMASGPLWRSAFPGASSSRTSGPSCPTWP